MIWNLGSINIDNFYGLTHLPQPGETIAAHSYSQGLGGKGANMSIASARAASRVAHIGAVGPEGGWAVDRLLEYGVDTGHIRKLDIATGHANIAVDDAGENNIILFTGANGAITEPMIGTALAEASPGDFLVMQNETNGQYFAAQTARTLGLRIAYAAAPFSADAVAEIVEFLDLMILNAVEAEQLEAATGSRIAHLGVTDVIVTLGPDGCRWVSNAAEKRFDAYPATVVDTTGAGDTFAGYLIAALDRGIDMDGAIDLALKAGALMVSRHGTGDVIPDLKEIQDHFD